MVSRPAPLAAVSLKFGVPPVLAFLLRRIARGVLVLVVLSMLAFGMVHLLPGNPVENLLGPYSTAAQRARLIQQLGLNGPLVTQYLHWVDNALHGDFGISLSYGVPVRQLIGERLPTTLELSVAATIVSIAWGVPFGALAAMRRGKLTDAVARGATFLVQAPDHATPLHPAVRDAVLSTAKLLEEAGHSVQESSPEALSDPRTLAMFFDALSVTVAQGVDSVREQLGRSVPIDDFDPITGFWDGRGREITGLGLADALTWQNQFRVRMGQWWADGFDLLLAPVFATPPRPLGWPWATPEGLQESVDVLTYTAPFNTTGQPAIAVPAAMTAACEPIGIQLVAGYGREDLLVQVAGQLEALRPWSHRHPDLPGSPG